MTTTRLIHRLIQVTAPVALLAGWAVAVLTATDDPTNTDATATADTPPSATTQP